MLSEHLNIFNHTLFSEKNGKVVAEMNIDFLAPLDADLEELQKRIQNVIDTLIGDGSVGGVDTEAASIDVDHPDLGIVRFSL